MVSEKKIIQKLTIDEDGMSKYDPSSVCFGRIRDILVSGVIAARSMEVIQNEIKEKTGVEVPIGKLDEIIDKYAIAIQEKEGVFRERLRWEQNIRTNDIIQKVMSIVEEAEVEGDSGKRTAMLKDVVMMLEKLHDRQSKLFGLNKDAKAHGGQTQVNKGIVVNLNLSNFDPVAAGYPDVNVPIFGSIESGDVIDADVEPGEDDGET